MNDLERRFHAALITVYERAKEHDYFATYFKRMLDQYGGLETAKRLLAENQPQQGLFKLWELGALDISVEATVLRPEFCELFDEAELATARQRLEALGYFDRQDSPPETKS